MNRRGFGRGLLGAGAAGLLLLLGACATPPKLAGHGAGAFARTGRFAVNVTGGPKGPSAVQGGFSWLDEGRTQRLDLANPLGSTLARVDITPAGAVLQRANGTREFAPSPNALMAQVVGSDIPVEGLRDWLRGRTDGGARNLETVSSGRVVSFHENGWAVHLSNYDAKGPRLLTLFRDDAGVRVSVRLVVDS